MVERGCFVEGPRFHLARRIARRASFFPALPSAEERTQGFFNAMDGNELDVAFGTLKSLEIGIGEDEA